MTRFQLPTPLPEPFSGIFKVMGFGSGATLQIDQVQCSSPQMAAKPLILTLASGTGVNHGWFERAQLNLGSPSHPSQIIMCEQTAGAVVLSGKASERIASRASSAYGTPAIAALLPSGALRWCGIRFSSTDLCFASIAAGT